MLRKLIRFMCVAVSALLLIVVCLALFIGQSGFSFTSGAFTQNDYNGIMKANIKTNPRVVDVAMLGAHDAFSNGIGRSSQVDPAEDSGSILNNKAVKLLAGGMFVRLSKAQKSGAKELFEHGVRYFDVRITYSNNEWYTTHGLLSGKLGSYLQPLVQKLKENPGEFVVFDIQHASLADKTFDDLFSYISSVKVDGVSLFSFVTYNPSGLPLGSLTYHDITANGTSAGAVILAKTEQFEGCRHYEYGKSMRSVWHNKNTQAEILSGIGNEYATLKASSSHLEKFRVNQAQMTGLFSADVIFNTILGWSLLDMAANFNWKLATNADFEKWLDVMPIFMVDYSDSMAKGFNDAVIEKINRFNTGL